MSWAAAVPWCLLLLVTVHGNAVVTTGGPLQVNGIFPGLSVTAESAPKRSECGVGALMPWADRLYMISYLSVPNAGNGTGLYEIDADLTMVQVKAHVSVYANRMMHPPTNTIIIGPYIIDSHRNIRTFTSMLQTRIGGMAEHLDDPDNKVYFLSMDGPLYEANVHTLQTTQLFDLVKELHIPRSLGEQPHFKAAHSMNGRLIVASNTFEEADYLRKQHGGRLAEWYGAKNGSGWKILEHTAFYEVTSRHNFGKTIYATGWDERSVILKVQDGGDGSAPSANKGWQRYRLPKASHAFDHLWQTEWPRIREVETERYLMDVHGMFFELSPLGWASSTWGLRPISQHLRVIPDYTSFRGMLVMGGNEVSSIFDNNWVTGQSQSGLWLGKTDDLWSWGKPQGWGGVWVDDFIAPSNSTSDPYLMTGFDKKVLHVTIVGGSAGVAVEVDFLGNHKWVTYHSEGSVNGYWFHTFPVGFSAHWVRLRLTVNAPGVQATAYFHYT